jgi:hypothetical protein
MKGMFSAYEQDGAWVLLSILMCAGNEGHVFCSVQTMGYRSVQLVFCMCAGNGVSVQLVFCMCAGNGVSVQLVFCMCAGNGDVSRQ